MSERCNQSSSRPFEQHRSNFLSLTRDRQGSRSPTAHRHDRHSPELARHDRQNDRHGHSDRQGSASQRARQGSRSQLDQWHERDGSQPGSPGRHFETAPSRSRHDDRHGSFEHHDARHVSSSHHDARHRPSSHHDARHASSSHQSSRHSSQSGHTRPDSDKDTTRSDSRQHYDRHTPRGQHRVVTHHAREGSIDHKHEYSTPDRSAGSRSAHARSAVDSSAHDTSVHSSAQPSQPPTISNRGRPSPVLLQGPSRHAPLANQPLPPPPPQFPDLARQTSLQPPQLREQPLPLPPPQPPVTAAQALPQVPAHLLTPPDPALDFFSEHFDALKALYSKGLQPPVPKVKPMDNVTRLGLLHSATHQVRAASLSHLPV